MADLVVRQVSPRDPSVIFGIIVVLPLDQELERAFILRWLIQRKMLQDFFHDELSLVLGGDRHRVHTRCINSKVLQTADVHVGDLVVREVLDSICRPLVR